MTAFRVFGWTPAAVAWLDLLAAALTTLMLFTVARRLSTVTLGAAAAALYATMTMPSWLYGNGGFLERAVSETFIVCCVSVMAWAAARWHANRGAGAAAVLGLAAGAAVTFKPNAGLYFPALLAWAWLYTPASADARRLAVRPALYAMAAAAVAPVVTLLWLWRLDLLHDARVAVVEFNRYYVSEGFDLGLYALTLSKALWLRIKTEPLWLIGASGAIAAVTQVVGTRRLPPVAGLAVLWGAAAFCVIVVNGARLFNSYFIQALPPLALLGAWFFAEYGRATRPRRIAALAVAVLSLILLVQRDYAGRVASTASADLAVLSGRLDRLQYLERFGRYQQRSGYSARANTEVADYVRARTNADDRIFLFSINGAGVYFEADRLSAHRFLRVNFFVATSFPDPAFRLEALARDLEQRRPVYVIFERLHQTSDPAVAAAADALPEHPALAPLLRGYTLETRIEDFTLYRRRP